MNRIIEGGQVGDGAGIEPQHTIHTDRSDAIEPMSVAADQEPERKVRTFRVLKRVGTIPQATRWDEQSTPYETIWQPDAQEIGEQYGEGHYLLIESDSKYDFHYVYPMRVVAEKRYRLADDETA